MNHKVVKLLYVVWCAVMFVAAIWVLCLDDKAQSVDVAPVESAVESIEWVELTPAQPTPWKYPMTWKEYKYVQRVVMAESGNQSIEGQMAVAQCILNTALETRQTAYQVVTTPGQYADPYPGDVTLSVKTACERVFRYGEKAVDENIRWFYNPSVCYSVWHESKTYVTTIGAHKFFA